MDFPQYRKYNGIETYFMIFSEIFFQELKISGKFYSINDFNAVNHFDKMFISDMLNFHEGRWLQSSSAEYLERSSFCENNLPRI
jgi:hypothetical protein